MSRWKKSKAIIGVASSIISNANTVLNAKKYADELGLNIASLISKKNELIRKKNEWFRAIILWFVKKI